VRDPAALPLLAPRWGWQLCMEQGGFSQSGAVRHWATLIPGKALTGMSVEISPPPTVTRFYGTVDYAVDLIRTKQIAFVHVSLLNDPFDPYCFFETDFEDKYQNLLRYVQRHHPKDMPWFRAQVTAQSWGKTVRQLKKYLNALRKHTFMLSTSAPLDGIHPKDNLYMWGHYGNGHRRLIPLSQVGQYVV
jgi:hypothetical protein